MTYCNNGDAVSTVTASCNLSSRAVDADAGARSGIAGMTAERVAIFWSRTKPEPHGGCVLWIGKRNAGGYGVFSANKRGLIAHRVAFALRHGPVPVGAVVRHTCDRRDCVNADHLLLGTHADNVSDRVARGRSARGERLPFAKLTESDVLIIRRRRSSGATASSLARRFDISANQVCEIAAGMWWRHVGGPITPRRRNGATR